MNSASAQVISALHEQFYLPMAIRFD